MVSERILTLAEQLRSLKHASVGDFKTGLSRTDMLRTVADYPDYAPEWIDEDVAAWWSFHDGVEPVGNLARPGVSPDHGLQLVGFRTALKEFVGLLDEFQGMPDEAEMVHTLRTAMFEMPVIPLTPEYHSLCLRRTSMEASHPWTVWWFSPEAFWRPLTNLGQTEPVTFDEYLKRLVERLGEGDMEMNATWSMHRRGQTSGGIDFPWR